MVHRVGIGGAVGLGALVSMSWVFGVSPTPLTKRGFLRDCGLLTQSVAEARLIERVAVEVADIFGDRLILGGCTRGLSRCGRVR